MAIGSTLNIVLKVVTKSFQVGLGVAGSALGMFGKLVGSVTGLISSLWRKTRLLAAAMIGIFALMVRGAAKFERQMAFVSTMIQDSEKWMKQYTQSVKRMSIQFGQSTEEMTKALYDILSASVPPAEALEVLKVAGKGAVAGFTEIGQVGKILSSIMNAMGISFGQVQKVADVLFRIVEKGQLTFSQLPGHMARSMVAARSARMHFEELAATYAFLTRKGFNVAQAETAIAAAIQKIMVPTKQAREAAKELGIDLGETAIATKGLLGVIEQIAEKGLSPEEIARLFPNVRAQRAIQAMASSTKEFGKDVAAMYNAAGAQGRAFAKATETLSHQWKSFMQSMKIMLIEVVEPLLPALTGLFKKFQMIGEYLRNEISVNLASKMKSLGEKAVVFVENIIFWLLQNLPTLFQKIWGWLQYTWKIFESYISRDFWSGVFSFINSIVENLLINLGKILITFFTNIAKRLYESVKWGWYKVKNLLIGTAIPEMATQFTGLFDDLELRWKWTFPASAKSGVDKAEKWYKKYLKEIEKSSKDRAEKLADLREKFNKQEVDGTKKKVKEQGRIEHSFEKEKMKIAKKASDEEAKRRLKLREERKQEAFEYFSNMEASERDIINVKIAYLEKYFKEEAESYEERKKIFKELMKLKKELAKNELSIMKKINDALMDDTWKRLKAEESFMKRRMFDLNKDSKARVKMSQSLDKNLRQQERRKWIWIEKLRVKDGKKWTLEELRRLKIAERHAQESLKSTVLTSKEKEAMQKKLGEITKEISKAEMDISGGDAKKKAALLDQEAQWKKEMEKKFADATLSRIEKENETEKTVHQERTKRVEEIKSSSISAIDRIIEKVKELDGILSKILEKFGQIAGMIGKGMGVPVPGIGRGIVPGISGASGIPGIVPGTIVQIQKIQIEQIDSYVAAKRAGEEISQEIASQIGTQVWGVT